MLIIKLLQAIAEKPLAFLRCRGFRTCFNLLIVMMLGTCGKSFLKN